MAGRRIVGWMDDSEWEAVYYNIFFGKREQIRAALNVISVWRARFAGRIPVAIEATSQLFESYLVDGDENSLAKRQCMSAAVSQFVGLLTERSLKGQLHASPMHRRGEGLGIPEWVTSLRHEAAHGFMPGYDMLDRAVKFALEWLRVNHWEEHLWRQRVKGDEAIKTSISAEQDLVGLLRQCVALGRKSSAKKLPFLTLKSFLAQLPDSAVVLCAALVDCNIIPIQNNVTINSKFYVGGKDRRLSLSQWAKSCFEKIFACLGQRQELGTVLLKLCQELCYPSTSVELCILWADFLLDISEDCVFSDAVYAEVASKLVEAKADSHIVQRVLDRGKILEGVKYDPNCREELLLQVRSLLSVSQSDSVSDDSSNADANASWTLCDIGTKETHLGLLPGQDKRTLWKDLIYGLAPVEEIIQNWSGFNDEPFSAPQKRQLFTERQIGEFCDSIDLL